VLLDRMSTRPNESRADDYRRILDLLRRRLRRSEFATWFSGAGLERLTDGELVVGVKSAFMQEWMTREFRGKVAEAAAEVLGRRVEVVFTVHEGAGVSASVGVAVATLEEPDAASEAYESSLGDAAGVDDLPGARGVEAGTSSTQMAVGGLPGSRPTEGTPTRYFAAVDAPRRSPEAGTSHPGAAAPDRALSGSGSHGAPAGTHAGRPAPSPSTHSAGASTPPVGPQRPENSPSTPGPATAHARQAGPPVDVPLLQPSYIFDNFITGPSNAIAHAAARGVADNPGTGNNPLFLYGSVGLGKTHLLQAICHELLRRRPGFRIAYRSCEQFTNEFVEALGRNATEEFRRRFRHVDMLVIDDVHFLANKERTQEEFFHTFNALYQAGKQIILSSDAPPTDIPTLEERLVSRFKWGLVEKLEQPETETRMAIIRRKAELMGLPLPNDVVEYVATNVRNNIREIEGAIASVRTRAQMEHVPVDLAIAKLALEATLRHEQKSVGIDRIAQVVASHFDVKVSDLRSKKRTKSISFPRQVVMFLARDVTRMSLLEIGEWFGGRDHTTVLYATDKITRQVATDDGFKHQLAHLKDRICAR